MADVSAQLEMFGLDGARRLAETATTSGRERSRMLRRIDVAHELMSELPANEDLSFLHSGLCQTCLPHSRPADNNAVWHRRSGRFSLIVQAGMIDQGKGPACVGVPYGPKARLILIHLQTEGLKSRTVNLGASFSAFMRSLGLAVTGGQRGTITAVREATRIVDRLELWRNNQNGWTETVELSERFHAHLREHAVPLDKRGLAHLSANSLGLDLYALFAYRLPRLERDVHLRWATLQEQIGAAEKTSFTLAQRVRDVMPDVHTAYPHARVEVTPHGLLLKPSPPAVPKTVVPGFRLADGTQAKSG